ncbi:CrcB family protein [Micrococcus sp.]|uniref:CrcB family protein n=1 Tax=Micrococcus sp. TaxID=1271 RepID=UPI002A91FC65|nr:CrcB family protein [Micrococcus sp.]MDY6055076.1 CrcB family protein [Micrococcus sp.]
MPGSPATVRPLPEPEHSAPSTPPRTTPALAVLPGVALGGAAGAGASTLLLWLLAGHLGPGPADMAGLAGMLLPLGAINAVGAFLLGLLKGRASRPDAGLDPRLDAALGAGFLGAFTSFTAIAALPMAAAAEVLAEMGAQPSGVWILTLLSAIGPLSLWAVLLLLGVAAAAAGLQVGQGRPATPPEGEA